MFRKNRWPLLVLLALSFIAYRKILFTPGVIGHNWDWSIPYFPECLKSVVETSLYTWRNFSFGQSNLLWLPSGPFVSLMMLPGFLSFTGELVSKLLIFSTSVLAGYFMFLLAKEIISQENLKNLDFPAFLAGLFYAFSPFLFADLIGGALTQILAYTFTPLAIFLFRKTVVGNSKIYLFFTVICFSVLTTSLQTITLVSLLILLYGLTWANKRNYYLTVIKAYAVYGGFNLYWLVPTLVGIHDEMQHPVLHPEFTSFDNINFAVPSLWEIFVGSGYFRPVFTDAIPVKILPIWLLVTYLAIAAILVVNFWRKKSKEPLFWLLVLLTSFIFATGGKEPLGRAVIWAYKHIPLMSLFRSPQHFIILPTLAIAVLMAFFTASLLSKTMRARNLVKAILFSIIIFWCLPFFFTGDLGSSVLTEKGKDHLDVYRLSPGYKEVFSLIFAEGKHSRVLFLPMAGSVHFLKNEFQNESQGGDPLVSYSPFDTLTADISFYGQAQGYAAVLEKVLCLRKDPVLAEKLINLGGFKYLILRTDATGSFTLCKYGWDAFQEERFLDQITGLSKIKDYPEIKLYENKKLLPHIYPVVSLIRSNDSAGSLLAALELATVRPEKDILGDREGHNFFQKLEDLRVTNETHQVDEDTFEFAVPEDQEYELWLRKNSMVTPTILRLLLDGERQELSLISEKNNWLLFGEIRLTPGSHWLKIILPAKENLLGETGGELTLTTGRQSASKTFPLPVRGDSTLRVSFTYQTAPDLFHSSLPPRYSLYQDTDEIKNGGKIPRLSSWLIKDAAWRSSEVTLDLNPLTENIDLVFFADKPERGETEVSYKNIRVEELFKSPVIISSMKWRQPDDNVPPQITWQRINPTRYRVKIERASSPFFLVFLDSFNEKWQAFINPGNTWLDQPISAQNHFLVNSYANGWWVDKTGDFEIILEYWPQRLFVVSLAASGAAVLVAIIMIIGRGIRKK